MPVNWGPSVYPTGAVPGQSAPIANRYLGRLDGNHPTSGTFQIGDWTLDVTTPGIWVCQVAGSPGTWVNAVSSGGPPTGAAGGDLSGTYPNPTVAKVNGTSVPATPSTNQAIVATGGTAATWQAIANTVFGRSGAVAATSGDYTAAQVTNAADLSAAGDQDFTGQVSAPRLEVNGNTGATLPLRWIGGNASGAPASGTWEVRDAVINTDGTIYVCTAAGTPGTWAAVGGGTSVPNSRLVGSKTGTPYASAVVALTNIDGTNLLASIAAAAGDVLTLAFSCNYTLSGTVGTSYVKFAFGVNSAAITPVAIPQEFQANGQAAVLSMVDTYTVQAGDLTAGHLNVSVMFGVDAITTTVTVPNESTGLNRYPVLNIANLKH